MAKNNTQTRRWVIWDIWRELIGGGNGGTGGAG